MNETTLKKIRNQYKKITTEQEKKDLFLEFCNLIESDLNQYNNSQINIYHFYFENMNYYFLYFGEKLIYNFFEQINKKIKNHLSEKDNIYQWNLRSLIVTCFYQPDFNNLYKRLNNIEFQIKGINLQYELSHLNLKDHKKNLKEIWKTLIKK